MKRALNYILALVAISSFAFFTACSDDDESLPPIDGYNNSDEVASSNLVAHWSFDDTNNEAKSGSAPANTYGTVGFTDGQVGRALQLTKGALVYPSIPAIGGANSLGNYTVSMWVNVKNNGGAEAAFTTFFGIFPTATTEFWGNLSLSAETSWFPATGPVGDTLVLKTNYLSLNGDGSLNGQDNRSDPRGEPPVGVLKAAGQWVHFVVRFNATTHLLEIFGNSASIGAYNDRGVNTGALVMRTPAVPVFGSLATTNVGFSSSQEQPSWQTLATASVDDVRVFNTALSNAEITALFNLGTAGR
jgi:hypothetical protein